MLSFFFRYRFYFILHYCSNLFPKYDKKIVWISKIFQELETYYKYHIIFLNQTIWLWMKQCAFQRIEIFFSNPNDEIHEAIRVNDHKICT